MVATPERAQQLAASGERAASALPEGPQRRMAVAKFSWLQGEALVRMDNASAARPSLTRALKMVSSIRPPIQLRGDILMSMGTLDLVESRAAEALSDYQSAYNIFHRLGQTRGQAMALQNIASLYHTAGDDVRAERYYRQAAETFGSDPMLSLSLHNNRGNVLLALERYGEAETEFQRAMAVARSLNNPLLEARVLVNLARTQVDLKQFDGAQRTLDRAFRITGASDAPLLRRHLLATAARMAADQGDYAKAARLIRECFDGVDLTTTSTEFRNAHLYAHEIFSKIGRPDLALAHLEALKRINDQAAKVATTTGAALMAARFDYANQQTRIANLKVEEARRTAEYQRTLFLSIGGATLVLLAMLSFGLFTIRRSRNQVRAANVVLNRTNVALEKALKAKTEFLATTSHEIRTPLNGILGMTQVMLSDAKLDGDVRDRIGIVHGAGVTMRALVDDILDVAKMETGNLTIDPAPMNLPATLREVTRMWEEQGRARGLSFRLEMSHAPGWIICDAGRLRQIVFNLLSNALKFTQQGGVTLRVFAEGEDDARRLKLSVADTGIGIPADKLDEIFESFRQVDAGTTRQFGGTGLGLAICRNLARALGGDVTVESQPGEGARFIVDLPLIPAEAPTASPSPQSGPSDGALLVLERNPIARSMLRTLLSPHVPVLRFALDVEEALAILAEGGVARLLADEMTLKRADPWRGALDRLVSALPPGDVALLWSRPEPAVRDQLSAFGVTRLIEKPVAGAALIAAIVTHPEEKTGRKPPDPLVSQAA
jgi:signal transduction histidine kinase